MQTNVVFCAFFALRSGHLLAHEFVLGIERPDALQWARAQHDAIARQLMAADVRHHGAPVAYRVEAAPA
jgi:hypothetical protein